GGRYIGLLRRGRPAGVLLRLADRRHALPQPHGVACELADDDLDGGLRVYPGPSDIGATALTWDDVTASSPYRLYRATTTDVWPSRAETALRAAHNEERIHRDRSVDD